MLMKVIILTKIMIIIKIGNQSSDGYFSDDCFRPLIFAKLLGETGYLESPYFLVTGSLSIHFFDLPVTVN